VTYYSVISLIFLAVTSDEGMKFNF